MAALLLYSSKLVQKAHEWKKKSRENVA